MASIKQVTAGNVKIGGGAKVTVQSMLNIPANDIENSVHKYSPFLMNVFRLRKVGANCVRPLPELLFVLVQSDFHFVKIKLLYIIL